MREVILEAYWETGTEGVYWAVEDVSLMGAYEVVDPHLNRTRTCYRTPYAGLVMLEAGHRLRVYADEARDKNLWTGVIAPETSTHRRIYPWLSKFFDPAEQNLLQLTECQDALRSYGFSTSQTRSRAQCTAIVRHYFTQQVAGGMYCHWLQPGVEPNVWADWFSRKLPSILE